jgi:hypothetical protein
MTLSSDMREWYIERTNAHIKRVKKYAYLISDFFPEYQELRKNVKQHDKSKFQSPEYVPYVFITWDYKCKREGIPFEMPQVMKDKMNKATEHHILSNKHHPEYWVKNYDPSMLNRNNRDAVPDQAVDASKMPDVFIAEMCADWMAMSEELKSRPHDWADMNVNVRWLFTDRQKELIYTILDTVWDMKKV